MAGIDIAAWLRDLGLARCPSRTDGRKTVLVDCRRRLRADTLRSTGTTTDSYAPECGQNRCFWDRGIRVGRGPENGAYNRAKTEGVCWDTG